MKPQGIIPAVSSFILAQTVFRQISIDIVATGKGASGPTLAAFRGGINQYSFVGATQPNDEVFFNFHLPHNIKPGVAHSMHIHWAQNVAEPAGDVKWQIEYSVIRSQNSEVFPAPTTVSVVQTVGAQYESMVAFGITLAASAQFEPDAIFMGRLFRDHSDIADTSVDPAFAFVVDFIYQSQAVGTLESFRPFLSTGF